MIDWLHPSHPISCIQLRFTIYLLYLSFKPANVYSRLFYGAITINQARFMVTGSILEIGYPFTVLSW